MKSTEKKGTGSLPFLAYIRPWTAWQKMKAASELKQTVYLYGMAGIGKTSFIQNFLNKKKHFYVSVENLNLTDLREQLENRKGIVVIDDLHLANDSVIQEQLISVIKKLVEQKEVWLILCARCRLAPWLMPIHVQHIFAVIGDGDLLLKGKEQEQYFNISGIYLKEDASQQIESLSGGCPLFLRMAAIEILSGKEENEAICNTKGNWWDYLDYHVYDQWEVELQEFVMELSIVDEFDSYLAEMITGRNDVEKMLQKAREAEDFLLEEDGIMKYRPLFRESMLRRLKRKYSNDKINCLYYNAGHCYELEGKVPLALLMYQACNDENRISGLLISNARKNPASGHYYELRKYYLSLPEESIRSSVELMAGMSLLQSMLLNQEESERWYGILNQHVAKMSGSSKREAESKLLFLDISLPHRGISNLVEILKRAGSLILNRKVIIPELSVTSNLPSMLNGGKDFCEWSRHDRELAISIGKVVEIVLGKYGKGLINLALAESFLEKGKDSYEIATLASRGKMQADAGGKIEQVFVAAGILAQLHIFNGHAEDALELLDNFEGRAKDEAKQLLPNIETMRCRYFLYLGETAKIKEWMESAPNEHREFCTMERMRYLNKVRIYIQTKKFDLAIGLLNQILYYADLMNRTYIQMEVTLLMAVIQYRMGKKEWKQTFQECISQTERYHFVRLISREGAAVWELLKSENFQWKNEEYHSQVMEETERMAVLYPSYLKEKVDGAIVLGENALKILRLQAEGMSVEEIAEALGIKKSTVKYHNQETYKKLGVTGKAAAVNEARKRNII